MSLELAFSEIINLLPSGCFGGQTDEDNQKNLQAIKILLAEIKQELKENKDDFPVLKDLDPSKLIQEVETICEKNPQLMNILIKNLQKEKAVKADYNFGDSNLKLQGSINKADLFIKLGNAFKNTSDEVMKTTELSSNKVSVVKHLAFGALGAICLTKGLLVAAKVLAASSIGGPIGLAIGLGIVGLAGTVFSAYRWYKQHAELTEQTSKLTLKALAAQSTKRQQNLNPDSVSGQPTPPDSKKVFEDKEPGADNLSESKKPGI